MAVNQTVRLGLASASKISYVDICVWGRENGREEERNGKRKANEATVHDSVLLLFSVPGRGKMWA